MYQDLHVIDFHSHFPTSRPWFEGMGPDWRQAYIERVGERRAQLAREQAMAYNKEWRLAWDFPPPEKNSPPDEEQAKRWANEIERYSLRAVGFVTGGGNDHLASITNLYPGKFIGFAHNYLFAPDAAAELKRAVNELDFRGYKLLAPGLDRPIEDRDAYPVWETCAELDIPVLVHFGVMGSGGGIATHENINPLKLHNVAKDFPDVTFVVPHFGCAWVRETLQLCWACRNVCIDTSGSNQWIRWVPGDLTIKELFRKYLGTIGPERIIFGSDSSWFPRGFAVRYLQDQIRDAREIGMSHEQLQLIFGGNAARLFKIDLAG